MVAHPDYPTIELKPSLAVIDYDQTYDLVYTPAWHSAVATAVETLMQKPSAENYYGYDTVIAAIARGRICCIDRYFAEDYPIATDYSGKIYYALRKYTNTGLTDNIAYKLPSGEGGSLTYNRFTYTGAHYYPADYVNGQAWVDDAVLKRDYYDKDNNIDYDGTSVEPYRYGLPYREKDNVKTFYLELEVPPSEYPLYIVYGVLDTVTTDAGKPYHNSYAWVKHVIPPHDSATTVTVTVPSEETMVQPCSLVAYYKKPAVNGVTVWESATDVLDRIEQTYGIGLTYRNLDGMLNELVTTLDEYFPYVAKGVTVISNVTMNWLSARMYAFTSSTEPSYFGFGWGEPYFSLPSPGMEAATSPVFPTFMVASEYTLDNLPSWYQRSCYRTANNNRWSNRNHDTVYTDHGNDFYIIAYERNAYDKVTKYDVTLYKRAIVPFAIMQHGVDYIRAYNNDYYTNGSGYALSYNAELGLPEPYHFCLSGDTANSTTDIANGFGRHPICLPVYYDEQSLQHSNSLVPPSTITATNSYEALLEAYDVDVRQKRGQVQSLGLLNHFVEMLADMTRIGTNNDPPQNKTTVAFYNAYWQPLPQWTTRQTWVYSYVTNTAIGELYGDTPATTAMSLTLDYGIYADTVRHDAFELISCGQSFWFKSVAATVISTATDTIGPLTSEWLFDKDWTINYDFSAWHQVSGDLTRTALFDISNYEYELQYKSYLDEEPVWLHDPTVNYCTIEEIDMTDSLRIKEIHATLGAGEFAYYEDAQGDLQPAYMNVARRLDLVAKSLGVSYYLDGSVLSVRQRKAVPHVNGSVTLPQGWGRGQFITNHGDERPHNPLDYTRQNGGLPTDERLGIAYQNRSNTYNKDELCDYTGAMKITDKDNAIQPGDLVLCENWPQYWETYLEDLDKGLNWQEMGTGIIPNADNIDIANGEYCRFEGIGTLLAEVAWMLSTLSRNIIQSHNIGIKNEVMLLEIIKGLGLPVTSQQIGITIANPDWVTDTDGNTIAMGSLPIPQIADDAPSITQQIHTVMANLALLLDKCIDISDDTVSGGTTP